MKKLILSTVVFLLSALSSNAQYSLLLKDQINPFDSAVAIQIDMYRLESKKMQLADTLIASLKAQLANTTELSTKLENRVALLQQTIDIQLKQIEDKNVTISRLIQATTYRPEDTWWGRNKGIALFSGGVVIGGGVLLLLIK